MEGPSRTDPEKLRGRTRHNKTVNFTGRRAARASSREVEITAATSTTLAGEELLLLAGARLSADVIAIFGPTGIGKTAVAIELAELLRAARRGSGGDLGRRLQVYDGLEILTRRGRPDEQERLEHRLVAFVRATSAFSVGEFMPLAHAEIDAALADGRRPIVVGGTGLYLRAALTELDLQPPPRRGGEGALDRGASSGAGRRRCTGELLRARALGGGGDRARRPQPDRAHARAAGDGGARARPGRGRRLPAVDRGHAAADAARRADDGARRSSTRGSTRRVDGDGRGRRGGGGEARWRPPARHAPRARRSATRSCWRATSRR